MNRDNLWNVREFADGSKVVFIIGKQGVYDLHSPALERIVQDKIEETSRDLDVWNELRELAFAEQHIKTTSKNLDDWTELKEMMNGEESH